MSVEKIRSFIAIELPESVKIGLAQLEESLKHSGERFLKWVDPNNIHLTLKFLGDIPVDRVDSIAAAIREAVKDTPPFHLEITELGVFPNPRRVQVVWVGLDGGLEKLNHVQNGIETKLAGLGFAAENRPFTPHLTIARVRDYATPEERQKIGQLIANKKLESDFAIDVGAISLMRSQLTREGPIYTRLGSFRLENPR